MEGVDLAKAMPANTRLWNARGLALPHLAAGDMDEALKVMTTARSSGPRTRKQNPNQPRHAAKETSRPAPPTLPKHPAGSCA